MSHHHLPSLLLVVLIISGCSKREYRPEAFRLPPTGADTGSNLKIGDRFPKIESLDLDGDPVTLDAELLGDRYTLVVFWSTWCWWCMHELPHEIELANEFKDEGLRVICINADATIAAGKRASVEHKIPWMNLYEGKDKNISTLLGVSSWPQLFLLDDKGVIISSSNQLRRHGPMFINKDGDARNVHHLDWTLYNLIRGSAGTTLYPERSNHG